MPNRPQTDPLSESLADFSEAERDVAMSRFQALRPHVQDGATLTETAAMANVTIRTIQRWAASYRDGGLAGLARRRRSDAGHRRLPADLVEAIKTLTLGKPRLSAAAIRRRLGPLVEAQNWRMPSYAAVHAIVRGLDPGLVTLAHDGAAAYRDRFELIHRHRADRPNAVWQADHTQLDLLILDANAKPVRPWLTIVIDDHSRAIAGYATFIGAPSALQTALALRQAIWRKTDLAWPVCGIPDALYVDHGSDFTSRHLEQVAADLRIELTFSTVARPQGRGKVERFFGTVNSELLPELPGTLVNGKPTSAPSLTLSDLDKAVAAFIIGSYNARPHSGIGLAPKRAWLAEGWLPRLPESLEALDLLLLTVAKSRLVRRDGIYFQGLRYMDPTLAAYVGEDVVIRYDPRDVTEIRVFHRDRFLCRAVSPEHAGLTISLKDIQQARTARRKELRGEIATRTRKVTEFLAEQKRPAPARPKETTASSPRLALYEEDRKP